MKRKNERNNVENKFRSILHGVGHFSCSTGSQEKVLHHRGAILDYENKKGITLIALIITIILMLILAGVVISLTLGENGLFKTAEYAVVKTEEEKAREKLELALADLTAHKYTSTEYDENKYINDYLIKEGMTVEGDIVLVDGWRFTIDRTVPKIGENLGQGEIKAVSITIPYVGTTSFATKIVYVYNEIEIEEYKYIIDNIETSSLDKEYTTPDEQELQPESTHTIQVIAKYKDGTQLESNILTIKTEPRTYLYNNGDECIDASGGWKAMEVGNKTEIPIIKEPTLVEDTNLGCIKATLAGNTGYSAGSIAINKEIDYSKYKFINIVYTANLTRYNSATIVQLYKNYAKEEYEEELETLCYNKAISTKTKCTIDLSKIENFNNFYIYLQAYSGHTANLNIYEVWLDK